MNLLVRKIKKEYYIIGKDGKKETILGGPYNTNEQAYSEIKNNVDKYKQWTDNTDYAKKNQEITYLRNQRKLNINDPIQTALDSVKLENQNIKNELETIKLEVAKNDTIKKPIAKIPVNMLDDEFLSASGYVVPKDSLLKFYDQKELSDFQKAQTDYKINQQKEEQSRIQTVSDSLGVEMDKQKLESKSIEDSLDYELKRKNLELKERDLDIKDLKFEKDSMSTVIKGLELEKKKDENLIKVNSQGKAVKKLDPSQIDAIIKKYKTATTSYITNKRLNKDTTANEHTMELYRQQLLDYDEETYAPIFTKMDMETENVIKDIDEYNNKSSFGKWLDRMFSF